MKQLRIINKKATFDYTISDRFEVGISLLGCEVKSIRTGHAKLEGSFVRIVDSELVLVNAEIFPYAFASAIGYDPKRTRRLLAHKREILGIQNKMQAGRLTLIPLSLYTKGPHIKLEVGIASGKKEYEKREKIKKKTEERELERAWRGKIK